MHGSKRGGIAGQLKNKPIEMFKKGWYPTLPVPCDCGMGRGWEPTSQGLPHPQTQI